MSPQSREHSRSPRRARPEDDEQQRRISKSLVRFGRYPEACPKGLCPDANGAFRLRDLVKAWGHGKGYSDSDIIRAVRAHMLHEDGCTLRFSIGEGRDNGIVIRVMPRRGGPHMKRIGDKTVDWYAYNDRALVVATPQSTSDKLDQSLDDLIRQGRRPQQALRETQYFSIGGESDDDAAASTAGSTGGTGGTRATLRQRARPKALSLRGSVRQSFEQGLPALEAGAAQASGVIVPFASGSAGGKDGRSRTAEKIQKWLSWVLKVGHKKVGLDLASEGCARLDDLAKVLGETRPSIPKLTGAELGKLIEAEDRAGRFDISAQGLLRKVPRESRVPRSRRPGWVPAGSRAPKESRQPTEGAAVASAGAAATEPAGGGAPRLPSPASSSASSGDSLFRRRRRGPARPRDGGAAAEAAVAASDAAVAGARRRSRSRSASPGLETDDSDLAERCGRALHVSVGQAAAPAGADAQATGDAPPRPPKPPGQHWTQYVDDGMAWWCYDGPLGKWAFVEGSEFPEPYVEEDP